MSHIKMPIYLLLTGFLYSIGFNASGASIDCSIVGTAGNMTTAINVSSQAGNDLPIGSSIYRMDNNFTIPAHVHCSTQFALDAQLSTITMPFGPPSYFSGLTYGRAPVYPTNVSGVGVSFSTPYPTNDFTYFSSTSPLTIPGVIVNTGIQGMLSRVIQVDLIKTGTIASGSVVQGSSFPTVAIMAQPQAGYTGLPLTLMTLNWGGTVSFATKTCSASDVNVNMGTIIIQRVFKNIGSTSNWVDSSIILQNCPQFSGYYSPGYPQIVNSNGNIQNNPVRPNLITVSITPNATILDSANGVFAVNAAGSTGTAATGLGIQLGYTSDFNGSPTSPATIWTPGTSWDIRFWSPNNSSTLKIPLAARYYQTSNTVTPGPANASVTFNIDYK